MRTPTQLGLLGMPPVRLGPTLTPLGAALPEQLEALFEAVHATPSSANIDDALEVRCSCL